MTVPGPQLAAKPVPQHTAQGFLPAGHRTEEPVSFRNVLDEAGRLFLPCSVSTPGAHVFLTSWAMRGHAQKALLHAEAPRSAQPASCQLN